MTQKIRVVVNIPDREYAEKLVANAVVDIVEGRINKLPVEHRKQAYNILLEELKK